MASYDAKINVLLSGLRDLVLLEDRLEKIGNIVNTLNKTPIALNVGGRGKERDLSGQLSKEVNDYVRAWVNGGKTIGKSINAVQQQAAAFQELLRETAMVQQDPAAKNAVKNLAEAWADTTRAATQYDKKLNDIQRKALGLQPQAIRDLEVARRESFVRSGGKRKVREDRATQAQEQQDRIAFLAGAPVSQFPIGPNPRSARRTFSGDTSAERAERALRAKELQAQRQLNVKFFAEEKAQIIELDRLRAASAQKQTQRIQAVGKAVTGSLSSAAIGGAFPLLFGQSPQAAVGGAIGGLLGGAGGGFAGSLLGTALGEIEAAKARTKELSIELGLSSTQAKELGTAFELAGRNSQQLEAAITNIQGLGLSTDETASAIKIAVELSKEYGGSVEKVAQAFADTLESGKVSVSTLNKFTAQGIPIQDELAAKLGVSRTKLLEMAKDGKISVQQVTDVLVDMGREAEKTTDKSKTGFDRFTKAVTDVAGAIAGAAGALLKILVPALDTVLTKLASIITRATQAINLLTDATVGQASVALAKSGFARGTLTANKGNIDALTQGLKTLQPRLATTKEQFDLIAATTQRYRAELQQYGGALGEYAVGTAQVELSRVIEDLAVARTKLGATPAPAAITGINAPANLPPSGSSDSSSRANEDAKRLAEQTARQLKAAQDLKFEQQNRLRLLRAENEYSEAFTGFSVERLEIERRYNELLRQSKSTEETATLQQARSAEYKQSSLTLQQKVNELLKQAEAPLNDAVEAIKNQAAFEREYGELIKNGTNPELAKQIIEIRKAYEESVKLLEPALAAAQAAITKAEAEGASATEIQKYREELERIEAIRKGLEGKKDEGEAAAIQLNKPKSEGQKIQDRLDKVKDDLKELTSLSYQVTQAAESIGAAFGDAFKGLVTGSLTAKEALASFFKSVGDYFLDMASKMIAKMIEIFILQTALGIVGGAFGGGGGGGSLGTKASGIKFNPAAFSMPKLAAEGAYWSGGFQAFANGGLVTKPTLGLVGEGGESEYIIPSSKMQSAMARYSKGARGNAVLAGGGGSDAGTAAGGPIVIDVRASMERINSVDYVTADQFQAGIQQAAQQGAAQGERRTLQRLQQSPSTRRRVGVG